MNSSSTHRKRLSSATLPATNELVNRIDSKGHNMNSFSFFARGVLILTIAAITIACSSFVTATALDDLIESYDYDYSGADIRIIGFTDSVIDQDGNGKNDTLVINLTTNETRINATAYFFVVGLFEGDKLIQDASNISVNWSNPVAQVRFDTRSLSRNQYNYSVEIRNQDYSLAFRKYRTQTQTYPNYERGTDILSMSNQNNNNNTIRITLNLNVTKNETVNVTAHLTYNNDTISATKQVTLTTPAQNVTVDVDNETIKNTHYVGTFNVSRVRIGERALTTNHVTRSYNYAHFAKTSFVQSMRSGTTNVDGDEFFDALQLNLTINVKSTATYMIEATFYDETDELITTVTKNQSLSIGTQTVTFNVSGSDLYSAKFNGWLSVSTARLVVGNSTVDTVTNAHTTALYAYTDFERPPLPDLVPTISLAYGGGSTNVTLNVTNQGSIPAYNVFVDLFDNRTYENETILTILVANQTTTLTYAVPNTTNNTLFVAILDFDNFVDETNETNNVVQSATANGSGNGSDGDANGSSQPRLTISLITPSANTNVTRNAFFPFTTQVCCLDANCSQVNVSLDPERAEYTYTSEKHCVGDECTTTLYSTPRYGFEDDTWKPIDQLKSFKDAIPIICDVRNDGEHLVECVDYNSTHRTLQISLADGGFFQTVPVRILTPTVTANGITWSERSRTNVRFLTPWQDAEVTVPVAYADEIHVGETSTNISYLPNASAVEGWWEATGGGLTLYGWSDCDANTYSAGDKSAISVNTTAASIYGEGGGSATNYTYCHRIRWNVTQEPSNISRVWAYSRWTGSLSSGADSITKAFYLGNVTGHSWKALHVKTNAWGEEQHDGEVTSSITDFVNDTTSGNYIYTLLHMNASKPGSTKAYSNYYYAELKITSGSGGGDGGGGNATKSGLVSTSAGTTPFYTNGSNPVTIALNQNQCQNVTWYVNATGNLSTTHMFYAYANKTSNLSVNNRTSTINITISNATGGGSGGWSVTDTDDFASSAESWTDGGRDTTTQTYNSTSDWSTIRKNYALSASADVINISINDFWYSEDTTDPKIFVPGDTASDNDYLLFDGTKPNINWKHIDDSGGYGECNQDIIGTVSWTDGDSVSILVNYSSGQWCTYHNGQKCRCETSILTHGDNLEISVGNAHVVAIDNVVYSQFEG